VHIGHDIPLVLLGQYKKWTCRTGSIGIADDEKELPIVFGDVLQRLRRVVVEVGSRLADAPER